MPWILEAEGWNFRNHKHFTLFFDKNFNIFYGRNGQGKTSLLEALFAGLRGKSFRPYTSFDFIQSGQNQSSVQLQVKEKEGESSVFSTFQKNRSERQILYCGKKVAPCFLEKKFPVLVFTSEKINVIKKEASERRNLVDELLIFQGKKLILNQYKKSFQQKSALLSSYQKGEYSFSEAQNLLVALNENFLKNSLELMKERFVVLTNLFHSIKSVAELLFSKPVPQLEFEYCVSRTPIQTIEEGESLLRKDLNDKMSLELTTGRPLTGPHRQEIKFLFNGQDSRTFCSQGQQRTFILSLIGTQINPLDPPFLFLDDVLSELDDDTQKKLLSFLEKTKAQVFLTSCRKVPWMTKKVSFFPLKNGTISSSL